MIKWLRLFFKRRAFNKLSATDKKIVSFLDGDPNDK